MPDNSKRWAWIVSLLIGLGLGIVIARYVGPKPPTPVGPPHPPPGPVIVVQPDPVDPQDPQQSGHWSMSGDKVEKQVEPTTSKWLNKRAYTDLLFFYGKIIPTSGGEVLVDGLELKATFRHCSDKPDLGCDNDGECSSASGGSCINTAFRVNVDSSTPPKFRWYMKRSDMQDEMLLEEHDYGDASKKWRAELCGRLEGDITVTGKLRSNPTVTVTGKVGPYREFDIQAEHP